MKTRRKCFQTTRLTSIIYKELLKLNGKNQTIQLENEWEMKQHFTEETEMADKHEKRSLTSLATAAAAAKSLQSCSTLCNPTDGSPRGSLVPGILQARTLEWVAISFSKAWKWEVKVKLLCRVWLFATPRTAAYQAPPPMGFSRQEYWSGCPWPYLTSNQSQVHLFYLVRFSN